MQGPTDVMSLMEYDQGPPPMHSRTTTHIVSILRSAQRPHHLLEDAKPVMCNWFLASHCQHWWKGAQASKDAARALQDKQEGAD